MVATPKIRRSYKGAPISAVLAAGGVTSATQTAITLSTSPSTWPTGKFFIVVAPGTAQEEKMCVTLSGANMTVCDPNVASTAASVNGRGVDNTTARSTIAGGATVYPVATAVDFDEANSLTSTYVNQGGIVYMGDPSFTQLGIGTANQVLRVNSGATAPEWAQVGTASIADSAVTTAKIADGTIVDGDINASAAIALSKLATGALPTAITIVNANVDNAAAIALSKLATGALPTGITVASANIVDGTIVEADLADGAVTSVKLGPVSVNTQTGTTYTLVLSDANKTIDISNASAITLTVPTDASVAFPIGTNITVVQAGAGQITVSGAGVTFRNAVGLKTRVQWSVLTLFKRGTNEWVVFGDTAP